MHGFKINTCCCINVFSKKLHYCLVNVNEKTYKSNKYNKCIYIFYM